MTVRNEISEYISTDQGARGRMQDFLARWLEKEAWDKLQFVRFLEGYDLPLGDPTVAPFQRLLGGLPDGRGRPEAENALAERAALLLADEPDVNRPGEDPNEVLFNLLQLCAGLQRADQLGQPLLAMYRRRALKGMWQGLDVRWALRSALAFNQIDDTLEPDWLELIERGTHDYLGGSFLSGIEGLKMMPPNAENRGIPPIAAIGGALTKAIEVYEVRGDKNQAFCGLVDTFKSVYPDYPYWDEELLIQALQYHWPHWAVESFATMPFVEIHCLRPNNPAENESEAFVNRALVSLFHDAQAILVEYTDEGNATIVGPPQREALFGRAELHVRKESAIGPFLRVRFTNRVARDDVHAIITQVFEDHKGAMDRLYENKIPTESMGLSGSRVFSCIVGEYGTEIHEYLQYFDEHGGSGNVDVEEISSRPEMPPVRDFGVANSFRGRVRVASCYERLYSSRKQAIQAVAGTAGALCW